VRVPESIRKSPSIEPPVSMAAQPQVLPVAAPLPQIPQFNDPVTLTEESARALLVRSVEPVYPRDAGVRAQGPVVLQALIGKDGSVEDLKIIRGYFVLSRAAIAAVRQWHFKPYVSNGRAVHVQTIITVNFGR